MDSESEYLRNQINKLKGNEGNNEELARSINSLIKLFAEASEDMKMDNHGRECSDGERGIQYSISNIQENSRGRGQDMGDTSGSGHG